MVLGTVLVCAAVGLLGLVGVTFAQYSNETFQVTIGDADDWPGATGLAYRYVDSIPSRAAGGAAGGWVVGGWAQHASAVARVAENGTVLWSHKLQFYEDGVPNSQTVVQCVAAMVDSGVVVAGYSYHLTPSESQAFVARLDDTGTTVFSHVVSYGGDTNQLRITACAAAADGGVMLMGEAPLGIFSVKLDRNGIAQGGWTTDTNPQRRARDLKALPNGNFAYSGNEYVPNDDGAVATVNASGGVGGGSGTILGRQLQAGNHWLVTELDPGGRPIRRGLFGDTEWGHNTDIVYVDNPPREEGYLLSGHIQTRQYETSILVLRVSKDLQTVVWSRHLRGLPHYTNDHSSQGVALTPDGLVVVTGIDEGHRSIAAFLNYSTGEVALAKNYGRRAERSHMQRVVTTRNGGLLFVGKHRVENRQATLTYLVKTGPRGDSGCAAREDNVVPPPVFDNAALTATDLDSVPSLKVVLMVEPSTKLQLTPWAQEQHIEECNLYRCSADTCVAAAGAQSREVCEATCRGPLGQ